MSQATRPSAPGLRVAVTMGVIVSVVTATPALGSEGPEVNRTAWAWREQPSEPLPSLEPLSQASEDALAIAKVGHPDKVAYLDLSLRAGPYDRVNLILEPDSTDGLLDGDISLRACVAEGPWPQRRPFPWDERPSSNCELEALAEREGGLFAFDLSNLVLARPERAGLVVSIEATEDSGDFDIVLTVQELQATRSATNVEGPAARPRAGGNGVPAAPARGPSLEPRRNDRSLVSTPALGGPLPRAGDPVAPIVAEPDPAPDTEPVALVAETTTASEQPFNLVNVYMLLALLAIMPVVPVVFGARDGAGRLRDERAS